MFEFRRGVPLSKPQYANYVGVPAPRLHWRPWLVPVLMQLLNNESFQKYKFISSLQENGQLAERRATEHFERLLETLQERKSEMLRSIEQSRNRRVDQLRAQVRRIRTKDHSHMRPHSVFFKIRISYFANISQVEEYQGMLENSGLVGYAQEVLKETDQSCFVQTAKQLHVR